MAKGASVRGAGTSSKHSSGRICRTWSWHERSPATAALKVADASSLGTMTLPTCLIVRAYAVTACSSCHPASHIRQYRLPGRARRDRGQLRGAAAAGAPLCGARPARGLGAGAGRLGQLFQHRPPATVLTWLEHRAHDSDLLRSRGCRAGAADTQNPAASMVARATVRMREAR